jgi:hypothetical protein
MISHNCFQNNAAGSDATGDVAADAAVPSGRGGSPARGAQERELTAS